MVVDIDPVIFALGPLQVRWYGLMYVLGFVLSGVFLRKLVSEDLFKVSRDKVDSYVTHAIIGMFLGARLIYVFIYNWQYYSSHLSEILSVWRGGLSYHGAVIGMIIGLTIFAKKNKLHPVHVFDVLAVAGSQGVLWGRLGNFINGELYGRVTDVSWGLVFKHGGPYPRHPSQLYEALFEGLILFLILWLTRKKLQICGFHSALYLLGYGIFRYSIEFFREPDSQLGYYFAGTTTMGQILCLIMICSGFVFLYLSIKRKFGPIQKLS
ncbi:MAG: prolipoprotein diacylglyceryl transferase [Bacteriovoracaceae bacterium]|nr:prolipoprotein diacylglyceryl transferase [Bacteriovoracaceae bacterium]